MMRAASPAPRFSNRADTLQRYYARQQNAGAPRKPATLPNQKGCIMIKPRTVGIVGMGHVGAHVANSLLLQGLADELYLCDIDSVKSASETQDLRDSLQFCRTTPRLSTVRTAMRSLRAATSSLTPPARSRWPPATATASSSLPRTPAAPLQTALSMRASTASGSLSPTPATWSARSFGTSPATTPRASSVRAPAWTPRACAPRSRSPAT